MIVEVVVLVVATTVHYKGLGAATMVQIQPTGSFMVALDLKLLLKSRCDAHRGRVSSAIGRMYVRIIRRLLP